MPSAVTWACDACGEHYDTRKAARTCEESHETRCTYTWPLPPWMGPDQADPCRCDLEIGHEGDHECEHIRARHDRSERANRPTTPA